MDKYRQLLAWQLSHKFALAVFDACERIPRRGWWLADQLQRASVSTCANIAEGSARRGPREFKRFLGIALASLSEVDALLQITADRTLISREEHAELRAKYTEASKATFGLLRSL